MRLINDIKVFLILKDIFVTALIKFKVNKQDSPETLKYFSLKIKKTLSK
jgi:hypothetical protein